MEIWKQRQRKMILLDLVYNKDEVLNNKTKISNVAKYWNWNLWSKRFCIKHLKGA